MGISALVVDGDGTSRKHMCRALEQGCRVAEGIVEAGTVEEARQALGAQEAILRSGTQDDRRAVIVMLIDPDLPDGDGRGLLTGCATSTLMGIVASHRRDDASVADALVLGAAGYLLKDDPAEVWADALAGLALGRPALSPAVARRLMLTFAHRKRQGPAGRPRAPTVSAVAEGEIRRLSPRESEVLTYLSKGLTIREIATLLGIRWFTVNDHIKSIYRKLDVSSRAEAAVLATRLGLV
jgi:two-component system nitrate/nitrite response regulator NarL